MTFRPLAEIVATLAGSEPRARIAELLGGGEEAHRVGERIAAALGFADPVFPTEETFWAVRKLLETLAGRKPLVVVFDDIHWAEPTFLDLVEHVADLSRSSPILLLCLARPELLEERPAWSGGKLNASSVLLGPLSARESSDLVDQLGTSPVGDTLRARVFEAAEGNPLFIEQMIAMLAEHDRPPERLAVPPTIQALLAARLDRLDSSERAVLEQASVVGREFSHEAVSKLVPEGVSLGAHLQTLVRKDLIRPAGSSVPGTDEFRFRHQLIRDAAYESLPKQARADSHESFAGWLDESAGKQALESDEIVGYHLEQAYRFRNELGIVDDRTAALAASAADRLAAPGRRAFNRGDLPAAVNLLSRAVSLMPAASRARAEALSDLGEALCYAGDLQRGDSTLAEAIELAAILHNRALEWRTRMVRLRVQNQLDPELSAHELESSAERGREVLTELGDNQGLARAWWMLAWTRWLGCRAGEAEEALEHTIEHARLAGAWRAEAYGLNLLLGAGLFGPLPVEQAIRRCEDVLGRPVAQHGIEASACRALAVLKAMKGAFDEARGLVARDRAILEELGLRHQAGTAAEGYGMVELLAGDPGAAERELRLGYETLEQMGDVSSLTNVAAVLAQALYAGGRYSEALRFSEISQEAAAKDDLSAQIQWRGSRAKVLARRRRTKKAEELAVEGVMLAQQTDFLNQHGDALLDLAEVRRLDGRGAEARRPAAEAVRLYEQKGNIVSAARGKVFLKALGRDPARAATRSAGSF